MWEGGRQTGKDGGKEGGIIRYCTVGNFSKGKITPGLNSVFLTGTVIILIEWYIQSSGRNPILLIQLCGSRTYMVLRNVRKGSMWKEILEYLGPPRLHQLGFQAIDTLYHLSGQVRVVKIIHISTI